MRGTTRVTAQRSDEAAGSVWGSVAKGWAERHAPRRLVAYAMALLSGALALAVTFATAPLFGGVRYLVPLAAVSAVALVLGFGPAAASLFVATLGLSLLFEPHGIVVSNPLVVHQLLAFVLVALFLAGMGGAQRRSRLALRAQGEEARDRAELLSLAHDAIFVWAPGVGIQTWNRGAEALYGFAAEEALGRSSHDLLRTRFPEPLAAIEARLEACGRWDGELAHTTKDGREVIVSSKMQLALGRSGRRRVLETHRDITASRRAESELAQLAAIVEDSDDAIVAESVEGRILSWNQGAERLFGYPAEETLGQPIAMLFPPERKQVDANILTRILAGERVSHYEAERLTKDGQRRSVSVTVSPLRGRDGRLIGASKIVRDTTEQKRAGQALRDSEARFRSVFHQAAVGIARLSLDGRFLEVNERYAEIVGYAPAELVGRTFQSITHPDDLAADLAQASRLARGEIATYSMEKRYVRKDQSPVWINLTASISAECGQERCFVAVAQDISEKKRAQDDVLGEKRRLETILATLPVGVFITDASGRVVESNQSARKVWAGERPVTRPDDDGASRGFYPDTQQPIPAGEWALARAVSRGETVLGQLADIERFDGTRGTILNSAAPILDPSGRILGAVDVNLDITDLRRAEAALRESEARLRRLFDSRLIGVLYFDLHGGVLDANDQFLAMVGYARADLEAGRLRWDEMTPPEYVSADARSVAEVRATGEDTPYEKEFFRKDGSRVAVLIGAALFDGDLERGVAYVLDVTERRRAEAALRQSEQLFRQLADTMPQIVWAARPDGTVDYCSRRISEYSGASLNDDGTWAWQGLIHPDDAALTLEAWNRALGTGTPYEVTHRIRRADGTWHWHLTRAEPARDAQGSIVRWFGFNTDVHDQRQALQELLESRSKLDAALASMTDAMVVSDAEGRFVEFNDAFATFHRFKSREECARSFAELLPPGGGEPPRRPRGPGGALGDPPGAARRERRQRGVRPATPGQRRAVGRQLQLRADSQPARPDRRGGGGGPGRHRPAPGPGGAGAADAGPA
ncbi:MAG: PAS domain S-box protein [Myxococcales bacterium]